MLKKRKASRRGRERKRENKTGRGQWENMSSQYCYGKVYSRIGGSFLERCNISKAVQNYICKRLIIAITKIKAKTRNTPILSIVITENKAEIEYVSIKN